MLLADRYQQQEPLGRGGMATVYRGYDLHLERTVAIKVLREVYSTDPKMVTRFQREAKITSPLQHPNIVQIYDYGSNDGSYFIVMELIEGTDLRRYLRSHQVLTSQDAIKIAYNVALGLGAAHRRGIVHRGVRLHNILVGHDGFIKLTDFGHAYNINTGEIIQYYSPDQVLPEGENMTPAADIYALGRVMFEILTGHALFDGDTPVAVAMQHIHETPMPPSQLNPSIPPALEAIILRCLEKTPEKRYPDGSQLAHALETLDKEA